MKFLIAAAKTGGHVFPASVIAQSLVKKNHEVIWQEAYGFLKSALPDHAVHAWIDPIVCTGLDKNILLLAVPNHFFKEWIESHYISNIETA